MADMSIYNSAEVRRAAQAVKRGADVLSGSATPELRSVRSSLPDNFQGDAANALSKRLYELDSDILKLEGALSRISQALYKFADEIDRADRELRSTIR